MARSCVGLHNIKPSGSIEGVFLEYLSFSRRNLLLHEVTGSRVDKSVSCGRFWPVRFAMPVCPSVRSNSSRTTERILAKCGSLLGSFLKLVDAFRFSL
jgi:hypothetical protein